MIARVFALISRNGSFNGRRKKYGSEPVLPLPIAKEAKSVICWKYSLRLEIPLETLPLTIRLPLSSKSSLPQSNIGMHWMIEHII